ncbi:MAG: gliding motility-associated C-terminal domain-containing protein [Bacteroidota bacterium]
MCEYICDSVFASSLSFIWEGKANTKKWIVKVIFILLNVSVYAQTKFEKLLWDVSPNMPATAFRSYVNTIEYHKNYYTFGFNDGYKPGSTGCNNTYDGWIVFKCDSLGNLIKAVRIGGPLDGERMYFPAIQTKDKGFLIPGQSSSFSVKTTCDSFHTNANYIKLDSNLNVQWLKSYGGRKYDVAGPVKQMKDGNYMAFGMTLSYGHGAPYPIGLADLDIYIMKMDTNGNLLWSMTYGTKGADILFAVEQDENDNFYAIGGFRDTVTGLPYPFIFKIDSTGTIQWANFYYSNSNFYIQGFLDGKQKKNLLYVLNGFGNTYPIAIKLHLIDKVSGNIIGVIDPFLNFYDNINLNFINSNFLVTMTEYNSSSSAIIGSKLVFDSTSVHLEEGYLTIPFKIVLASGSAYEDEAENVTLTSDGGFITGFNVALNPSTYYTNNRILLLKMDADANTCSPDTGQVPTGTIAITYTPVAGMITSINQGTVLSWTPTVYVGGKDSTLCFCPDIPVTISKNPVTCFSNGSATITPQNNGNYSYIWNPPVSTTNTASNLTAGNYTITITDSTGCKKTAVITITTNFNLPLSITGNSLICSSQTTTLTLHGAQALTWNTGQTDSIIVVQPSVTTTYSAVVVNGSCQDSVYFTVNVLPMPSVSVTPTTYTLNIGDTAAVQMSGATYYLWNPSFGVVFTTSTTAYITPTASAMYCVTGTDSSKVCADTSCVQLYVEGSCFDIRVPNVFTPNGDNVNDDWGIEIPCVSLVNEFHLSIVDRWGVKIYEANKPNARWDGRTISGEPVPTGTYYYTAEFKINNKKEKLKGYITLMK